MVDTDHDVTDDQQHDDNSPVIRQLRKQIKDLESERDTLRADKRSRTFQDAGIPKGMHSLVNTTYDGEMTVEAVREWAGQHEIPLATSDDGTTADTQQADVPADAQQRRDAQNRIAGVHVDSTSDNGLPPDLHEQIAAAEASQDFKTAMALKQRLLPAS